MFNLEQSISDWRDDLRASGIESCDVLDELETHLRDEIARRVKEGADPCDAFLVATLEIGEPRALKSEFQKSAAQNSLAMKIKRLIAAWFGRPEPELTDFTPHAQRSLVLARAEAPRLHHNFIGTEHILLGLLKSDDGIVRQVLQRMGVSHDKVSREIEDFVGVGPEWTGARVAPYTPRAKEALQLAGNEASALHHESVGSAHIFLGLLRENSGVAAIILKRLGIELETSRREVLKELAASTANN